MAAEKNRPENSKPAPEKQSLTPASATGEVSGGESSASLSLTDLKELFSMMQSHSIAEFNLEQGGMKVSVTTVAAIVPPASNTTYVTPAGSQPMGFYPPPQPSAVAPTLAPAAAPQTATKPAVEEGINEHPNAVPINSPMVGTFYRASSPEAPPFVSIGDSIKPGQVICIVEAMKLMNELKSEVAGKVVKIVATNGNPVQYGQPLFLVEPE
jgi:acetyl-CoA carboxylase biotin carboxyl carrier protein